MSKRLLFLCLSALVATSIATQCGASICGNVGDQCCGSRCYNPNTHSCINGVLCASGNQVCKGNVCYDPNVATCFHGSNATEDVLCGAGTQACGTGNSTYKNIISN